MRVAGSIAWLAAATLVALPVSATSVEVYERKFAEWMETFATRFGSAREYAARLETFIANDQFIEAHNARDDVSFTLGHNAFSHFTFAEFAATKKGLRLPPGYLEQRQTANNTTDVQRRPVAVDDVPESVDWVAKGGVTPVKNQGQCGSCWAFSTTGAVEGAAFVASGKLVSLSEQELVDCDHDGDQGCNGGLMDHAFHWIEKHKGICSEEAYAYHAAIGTCHKCKPVVKVSGFKDVNANDEGALKIAVAQQPVSVAIEADQREFQFYKTGVFDLTCGTQLDHGVLVVGYGTEQQNGKKFWKVKNSWGATWGESGYIRLSREMGQASGQCGVAMVPSYPNAAVADGTTDAISGIVQDELERYKEAVEALEEQLLAAEPKALRGRSILEELAEEQGTSVYEYFGEGGI